MREGIVGGSANRVWEGVCAVLCQCLHDAMGGHTMDMVGDTYRGGERRSRERCAKVRGFGTLSRHRTESTEWILFLLSFMSTLRLWNKFKRFEVGDQISESMIFNILKKTPS